MEMETLSCHSNETTWATTIKNIIYVETNVMNMYAKFQLHPLMTSEKKIFEYFFFENLVFRLPWQSIKISDLDKIHMVVDDYPRNISVKCFSKYRQ